MSIFRKKFKLDSILDDIANMVEEKISEQDSKLTSAQKEKMCHLHRSKLKMMLGLLDKDEPYYRWYANEIKLIKDNKDSYYRTMILSGAIAHFAFLDKQVTNNEYRPPPKLARLSMLQLLHEVCGRVLQKNDRGPLAI